MPSIYLSPSLQEYNPYIDGGNEEYYMNLIADAMEPYLYATGIQFTRNKPEMKLSQAINQSNEGNYDLHLALHSNAAPPALAGQLQGTDVYYYAGSDPGERAATIIANNFKTIYPDPSRVRTKETTSLAELRLVEAPAVLVEIAYHDNREDAQWIRDNIDLIARTLVQSLADYFGIPFVEANPPAPRKGIVTTESTSLNIRNAPNTSAPVVGQAPKGAQIDVTGEYNGWYSVRYQGVNGYASQQFIELQ